MATSTISIIKLKSWPTKAQYVCKESMLIANELTGNRPTKRPSSDYYWLRRYRNCRYYYYYYY